MALIQTGNNTAGFANVDTAFATAVRSLPTPAAGHFRAAFATTSLAFTNGVNVATIRNPSASLAIVTRLRARYKTMAVAAPAATGLEVRLSAFIGRSWTVLGTTNRTALTLTGNNQKMRTSFSSAANLEIGFASAVAGITGDTVTSDANPFAIDSGSPQNHAVTAAAAPGAQQQPDEPCDLLFQANVMSGEYPITLAQNEGIRVVFNVTTAAAGIIVFDLAWAEVSAFPQGS